MTVSSARTTGPVENALLGVPLRQAPRLLPGLAMALVLALLAEQIAAWLGTGLMGFAKSPISGIVVAIVLGLAIGNTVGVPAALVPGAGFCVKKLLRLGIILLGIRLSLVDVWRISLSAVPIIALVVALALASAWQLARRLHLSEKMGVLTAVGTSICGASAIVATAPCVDASDEEVSYAVANITLFGLLAMFLYPLLAHALFGAAPLMAGLFLGTSIHETAQVAGAALMYDAQFPAAAPTGGEVAVVAKLVRNALMTAVIPLVSLLYARRTAGAPTGEGRGSVGSHFPMFVLGFLALSLLRTVGDSTLGGGGMAFGLWDAGSWDGITAPVAEVARVLLTAAMVGVGLGTSYRVLRGLGVRPLVLGLLASALVGAISMAAIALLVPILG